MDPIRRKILKTGAAATAMAAAPGVFGQQTGKGGTAMPFYEKGRVRIHYEEAGSGFPLLLIPGGGLNSTIASLAQPFNPIDEFKAEYRCIAADLRNAKGGQSTGPLEIDRPWDSYTDDHIGLMDHLGIDKFMVMGFCMAGPGAWTPAERLAARDARLSLREQHAGLGSGPGEAPARDHHGDGGQVPDPDVPHQPRFRVHRHARFRAQLPDPRADPPGRHRG